jgi:signal transduction histidine kinase
MSKKTLYAFIVSFILLVTVIILNRFTFNKMKGYTADVSHTQDVIATFESLSTNFKSAQIYSKAYDSLTGRVLYKSYKKDADEIGNELQHLKLLVRDNPEQIKLVSKLTSMVEEQMPVLMVKNIAEIISSGESWRLNSLFAIHEIINLGIAHENKLLRERKSDLDSFTNLTNLLTTAFGILAIAIILLTFFSNFFISKKSRWLEGFLESILNTSQNGIVHYKAIREEGKITDFRLEFINKAIDRLLETKSTDLTGKRLSEIPSFVRESGLMNKYIEVTETGKPAEFETLYKRNNVEKWFLVSLAKLDDGVIASFHDISQLKKFEAELKENIQKLERSNTDLEQYAYVASHDLQEPLRKIRSFGSYLQETQSDRLDEKGKQQLIKMLTSAERMSVLIKDILSFSSLRKEDSYETTDLNEVLKTVLQDLDLLITQKNAVIESGDLPAIEAIPLQMNQLFYNLINNSLKFGREGIQPVISVSSHELSEKEKKEKSLTGKGPYYELVFKDNGIGFSPEYADQIFGLFKRLNDKQFYPGSGIGLALCKKVVDNHNGEITAEGREGEGARFCIILPAKHHD